MTLHEISHQIQSKTISFSFFKQSCLYLEDYLQFLFNTEDIESLDEEISHISDPRSITDRQKAYILTSAMLVNRVFTLIDSYFSSLAYEMSYLSNNFFTENQWQTGEPTKPIGIFPDLYKLQFHRLKVETEEYSFNYPREDADLISIYNDYYTKVRSSSTHNSSILGHFNPTLKSLVLSISKIDITFYKSIEDNQELFSHLDNRKYRYFLDNTTATLSHIFELTHQEMSEEIIQQIENMINQYGEDSSQQYEQDYIEFMEKILSTYFNILSI